MRLKEIADPKLAAALQRVTKFGSMMDKGAQRRNRTRKKVHRVSTMFNQRALDAVEMYPNISFEEFKDKLQMYYPHGDPEVNYFNWEDAYKEAKRNAL